MNHVLIVTSGIKGPTPAGGIGTAFYNLSNFLVSQNFQVSVLYTAHPHYGAAIKDPSYWIEYFRGIGINFIPLIDDCELYGQDMMKRSYKIYRFLKKNSHYQKVIFHDHGGTAYYSVLAKKLGINFSSTELIINAHGNTRLSDYFNRRFPNDHNSLITYFLEQKSLEYADQVISPSQFYLEWYRKEDYNISPEKSNVIQNVLLKNRALSSLSAEDHGSSQLHLCFFGRIEKLKGIFVLLSALDELIKTYPELNSSEHLKLSIIGNLTKINDQNIDQYISELAVNFEFDWKFVLNKNSEEALSYIKQSNGVIVNPTLGENSPFTVLEALEYQIPIIASDIPGIKELIDDNDHSEVLVPTGNSSTLMKKIHHLIISRKRPLATRKSSSRQTNNKWVNLLNGDLATNNQREAAGDFSPLISVCMPTTGKRNLTSDTLIALSKQDYRNFEINIVVDGGNPEEFKELHKEALEKLQKDGIAVQIHGTKLMYKSGACNYAVRNMCNGDFVLFFDDDDIPKEHMIATYVDVLKYDSSIDVLTDFCQCFLEDEGSGSIYNFSSQKISLKHISLGLGNAISSNLLVNYFGKANIFIRKNRFLEIGGMTETDSLTPYVDWDLFMKASLNNLKIEIIPEPLYYYRLSSEGSIFYNAHDYQDINALEKRYLGHQKIINTILNSSSFNKKQLKDYILFCQSQLALPSVIKKDEVTNTSHIRKLKDSIASSKKTIKDKDLLIKELNQQKEWYESTYEQLPNWWKKIGALIRLIQRPFK